MMLRNERRGVVNEQVPAGKAVILCPALLAGGLLPDTGGRRRGHRGPVVGALGGWCRQGLDRSDHGGSPRQRLGRGRASRKRNLRNRFRATYRTCFARLSRWGSVRRPSPTGWRSGSTRRQARSSPAHPLPVPLRARSKFRRRYGHCPALRIGSMGQSTGGADQQFHIRPLRSELRVMTAGPRTAIRRARPGC